MSAKTSEIAQGSPLVSRIVQTNQFNLIWNVWNPEEKSFWKKKLLLLA